MTDTPKGPEGAAPGAGEAAIRAAVDAAETVETPRPGTDDGAQGPPADAPPTDPPPPGGGGGGGLDPDILARLARLDQSDTDNAARLLAWFEADMLHVREEGWYYWNGRAWEFEGGQQAVERMAQETAKRIAAEAGFLRPGRDDEAAIELAAGLENKSPEELSDDEKRILAAAVAARERLKKRRIDRKKFCVSSKNRTRTVAMIAQALPHRSVGQALLDADPFALNVQNGILDFRKVIDPECPDPDIVRFALEIEFTPGHDPARMMSRMVATDYDAAAVCPRFEAFLERFQPDAEVRRYLQKLCGYMLTGLTAEQLVHFNYGLGANGKSTFMRVIAELMGSYAIEIPFASLVTDKHRAGNQASPDILRLPRRRLAYAEEPPKDVRWDEATVKQLTGGAAVTARGLYQATMLTFRPSHKLVVSGNERPPVHGVDHGTWRRLRLIPWSVTIDETENRDMDEVVAEILAEAPGILNWMLEGLKAYFSEGLHPPAAIVKATADYRDENDPIGAFVIQCVESCPNSEVTGRAMYEAYQAWAEASGNRPISETMFGRLMPQKGLVRTNKRIRTYLDVKLVNVPERPRSPLFDDSG